MKAKPYLLVSGPLFLAVAILHLLRIINGWDVTAGPWAIPMEASWVGVLLPGALCVWAFRLARG